MCNNVTDKKRSHPVFIQEFFWAQNRTLATVPQKEQHTHDPDVKVAQLDTKRCLKKTTTRLISPQVEGNVHQGQRQFPELTSGLVKIWRGGVRARTRSGQLQFWWLDGGLMKHWRYLLDTFAGWKCGTVSQARRLQLFQLTFAPVDDAGRCSWLRPLLTSPPHTQQSTRSRQCLTKWKLCEYNLSLFFFWNSFF